MNERCLEPATGQGEVDGEFVRPTEELDLAMREADVAIRLRQPTQPDLIQRKLFSVHFHAFASPEYLKRFGTPHALQELDNHRIVLLGGSTVPTYLENRRWLTEVGRDGIDALLTGELPVSLGAVTLRPGVFVGAGWSRTSAQMFSSAGPVGVVERSGWLARAGAQATLSVALTRDLSLDAAFTAELAALGRTTSALESCTQELCFDEVDNDGDGDVDAVSGAYSTNLFTWYENDGSQNFSRHDVPAQIHFPISFALGDLDGDHDLDIVVRPRGRV